jgi:proline racemase/trans-L-3-hydroxyproline dehydratase
VVPAHSIATVDYHTAGEPFRIVVGGAGPLLGDTILDKRRYAAAQLDDVRQLLVNEPRGHADMYGCFVTDPEDSDADIGVVFWHNAGYSTACGHGTIALVTWAVESGTVKREGPQATVVVDVPSGRLPTTVRIEGGKATSVRFRNVPSFVLRDKVDVTVGTQMISVDVAFGGAFYASVDVAGLGLTVQPRDLDRLIALGRSIKQAVELKVEVVHPLEPELRDIYGVIFFEHLEGRDGHLHQRNVTIFADGEVDRSPCGSGTSARLAILDASGALTRGKNLVHGGILGTQFLSQVVGDARVGDHPAVITEVEGSAHLTGHHHFVLDPDDPIGTGFLLR